MPFQRSKTEITWVEVSRSYLVFMKLPLKDSKNISDKIEKHDINEVVKR